MRLANIWLEHPTMMLNRTFSYILKDSQNPERGCRVHVELVNRMIVGFVDSITETELTKEEFEAREGYKLKYVSDVIDESPVLNEELYQLGLWMAHETISPVISCFQAMLPAKMKPVSNHQSAVKEAYVKLIDGSLASTLKQRQAVLLLQEKDLLRSEFRTLAGGAYDSLLKKNAIAVYEVEKQAKVEQLDIKEADYPLTELQKQAIREIENGNRDVILLHGLTGSGKTEVYMQLAAKKCREGKQVLILVPEISLTPQMVKRMTDRFGGNIAIYHSHLNNQERYEQYQLVRNNKVKIVVGTRSAVFMPFNNLGLIVMDEEHDFSYKQDNTPKYNCRDIAIKRGQTHNCKVILGSATPTLESYARALKGVYQLVNMLQRIHNNLPASYLINMQNESRKGNFIVSSQLREAIKQRYEKGQQSILLLNRRGYTPVMRCSSCGYTITCPHCDIAMSYHKDINKLVCHCCGYTMSTDVECPNCHSHNFRNYGVGTQRLTEEVQKIVPQARILRMDADSTNVKDGHEKILKAFGNHEGDILIGTQMISKGLDYPDVTLVGIFNADSLLGRNDYRCVETTFNLIVQASGRSGRGQQKGEVFIQAYDVNHYGMRLAVKQDYIGFFQNEMKYRHLGNYPPYCYLVSIVFSGKNEENVIRQANDSCQYFRNFDDIKALGPSQLIKQQDSYRYRIILKSKDKEMMKEKVWQWFNRLESSRKNVSILIDVDPYVID